jgi:hypothetical protein
MASYRAGRLLGALLLAALAAFGQEFRATLQGTVRDPTQAAIPRAEVTLTDVDKAVKRSGYADDLGHYLFSFLPPARYALTVRAVGFKTIVHEGISLNLRANVRLDVELPVGSTTETVSVVGDASVVQAESSSLGAVVPRELIQNLPLKGHSSLLLFNLAAGVVSNRYGEDSRPNNTVQNVLYSANGSPPASGDVSVDGVSNTVNVNRGTNLSAWVPAVDAVAEFKLQTGTLPAEYGRSGGSIMNIVIKSGTNILHGSLYEYFRNSALDANLFFPRGAGQKLAPFGVNTFGASVDGPVYLPRLYNGLNHTFFYFNYEGSREGNGLSHTSNVPTDRMRQGDFSESSSPVYNPFSVHMGNGVPVRDPFPGNIIPFSLQDPVGRRVMTYFPEPNTPGASPSTPWVQNFVFSSKWPRNYNATVVKVDHQTPRQQMFLRLNYGTARLIYPRQFDGIATPSGNVIDRPNFGVAVNDTFSRNAHTILDLRFGYTGGRERDRPWSDGFDLSLLGFPDSFTKTVQSRAFPTFAISNFQPLAGSPFIEQPGHTWSLQPSASLQRGRHLMKLGGEGRLIQGNFFRNSAPSGTFSFNANGTGGPRADTPSNGTGIAAASLLLGYGTGSIDFNNGVSIQNIYYALYFQDDYRLTPKLTLNLGLRYEYETPRTERYNRTTRGFAYDAPSPLQVPGLDLRGGLLYAAVNGQPRGLYNPDRSNFAPRIGFAYSLTKKTVLRGGYALSYIPAVGSVQPAGFSVTTPWVSTTDGITPKDLLSNPFPGGLLSPPGSSQGMMTLVGESVSFVDPSDRTPTFHNWQFGIQQELPSRTLIEIVYVGSRALRIIGGPMDYATVVTEQCNQLNPSYLSLGPALLEPVTNPFYGIIKSGPLSDTTVERQQLLRPYPQFTDVMRQSPGFGNSVYHSVQMRVEKKMAHGLAALVAYTVSKNINDIANAQNAYDRRSERALSEFDVPQRLTITAAWQLPFGRNRRFLHHASRALDLALGGWQLSTYSTFQSGFPLSFGLSRLNIFAAGALQRPAVVGDPAAGVSGSIESRLARYFNTSAFAHPADFTFGNAGPRIGSVRSPGMNNINLQLSKDFHVTEKLDVGFRASSFNLLNHPVFSAPNTNYGGSSFGRVFNQANLSRQTELAMKIVF